MWVVDIDTVTVGVVGMAVGAPSAVLVAEQLAASGAEPVVSITSAGRIGSLPATPRFVLIDRALRDEGTSVHYRPPGRWSHLCAHRPDALRDAFVGLPVPVVTGASWTTDAPYRETPTAIAEAQAAGVACVEMEAAALYAYAEARERALVCLAHVTNTMASAATTSKGDDNRAPDALRVAGAVATAILRRSPRGDRRCGAHRGAGQGPCGVAAARRRLPPVVAADVGDPDPGVPRRRRPGGRVPRLAVPNRRRRRRNRADRSGS